ncbi:MAG: helicase, partial [Sutterella wadsworthensis]
MATGQLIGEGFDHAPLDTLLLAMPLASAPVLTQYIGRIVRLHETKTDAEIIDIVDSGITMLERQFV